jgi:hypothetical protein
MDTFSALGPGLGFMPSCGSAEDVRMSASGSDRRAGIHGAPWNVSGNRSGDMGQVPRERQRAVTLGIHPSGPTAEIEEELPIEDDVPVGIEGRRPAQRVGTAAIVLEKCVVPVSALADRANFGSAMRAITVGGRLGDALGHSQRWPWPHPQGELSSCGVACFCGDSHHYHRGGQSADEGQRVPYPPSTCHGAGSVRVRTPRPLSPRSSLLRAPNQQRQLGDTCRLGSTHGFRHKFAAACLPDARSIPTIAFRGGNCCLVRAGRKLGLRTPRDKPVRSLMDVFPDALGYQAHRQPHQEDVPPSAPTRFEELPADDAAAFSSGENGTVVSQWRQWLPGPKHGVARGVAVFGRPGFARDVDGLNEVLGRCPALHSWAEGRGLALSGVPEDLQMLDQELDGQPDDALLTPPAGEVGLFLGSVIVNSAVGAQWRVWPNGHPIVVTTSGRELDVVALANRRLSTDGARLADVYADAVAGRDL